jgi:hypothetical protein
MKSLQIKDLHPLYGSVAHEEAISIANLGALVYQSTKDGFFEVWKTSQTEDETAKAESWRSEGRQAMLESVRAKLVAAEEASARAAAAEGQIQQLRASVDVEVSRKLTEALEGYRKDYEIIKMSEISELKERIAMSEGKGEVIQMLTEAHASMREKINSLETQLAQQLATNTKSSHAIGKSGEATVLDLLENNVCKTFTHSSVKDMTGTSHVADFHLWVMSSSGNKIKILIDSKKYKRPVNSDEINKLYDDMDADDECNCGIMISITSGICTKNQFGISRTLKQKPVLFLSFQDLSTENQKDLLCWGIQVLSELIGEKSTEVQQEMLNNLEQFLDKIAGAIKDIDGIIRTQLKLAESMRTLRGTMLKDLTVFRAGGKIEEECIPDEKSKAGCISIKKATGFPCGSLVVEGSEKCRHHTARVDKK